ncbi:Lin29, partial [Drosophila busckii]
QQHQSANQLSNHHLLFNAAAAAAAAAHLKSTAIQNHNSNSNNNNSNANNNNISGVSDHSDTPHSLPPLPLSIPLPLPLPLTSINTQNASNSSSMTVKPKQELQSQHHLEDSRRRQSHQTYTREFYAPGEQQSQSQSQPQSQSDPQQQQHHQQRQAQSPSLSLLSKPLSQGQQSPQQSLTPSGSSSTPDIKYSNEKLANEIQLQLSRSSSAAAISERTLEECWSTLQRLFMHKSAMQQIQQQIPRVGMGAHGVSSTASMGGGITPGVETKPHQCQQCMKSFSSNHQLVQHIRVHTGEKPYKCSYCDRRFKQLSHVQQHTRLHTGERPYKCHLPDCGRAFIQLSNLQQHLRNHDAQVERAKNRPFHCNICGKGFATESSLRTHTSKELQLHLGVLQQHAALIGGPNATSCPVCHKLFLGAEALMDHMKHVHSDKTMSPPPSTAPPSSSDPPAQLCDGPLSGQCGPTTVASTSDSGVQSSENYLGKRRTANHPCPVCGKHYVNEGSLRKHLACHAESSQLTSSLRMWPCSVCQAVFTHENGLLTHMDHMRMDPKHQFAAQYVLSRAAAEQRERESLLAAATLAATSATGSGLGGVGDTVGLLEAGPSLCPSPSANSECSSTGRLSSSSTSEPDHDQDQDQGLTEIDNKYNINNMSSATSNNNNNNNNINNNNANNNNNNNSSSSNNNNNINNNNNKIDINDLRLSSASQYTIDAELHANRMSLMAAASAAAAAVAASAGSRQTQEGVDGVAGATANQGSSAAVQAAVVNLAAAMRMNNTANQHQHHRQHQHQQQQQTHGDHSLHAQISTHHQQQAQPQTHQNQHHHQHQQQHLPLLSPLGGQQSHHGATLHRSQPTLNVPSLQMATDTTSSVMMSMMRGSLDTSLSGMHPMEALHHQHQHQVSSFPQQATNIQHPASSNLQHSHHHPETALRMHQQAEAILRSHTEAAFRLAASVAATNGVGNTIANSSSNAVPNSTTSSTAPDAGCVKTESTVQQHQNESDFHTSPQRFSLGQNTQQEQPAHNSS